MKRTLIFIAAASFLCAIGAAQGGVRKNGFEFGVRLGGQEGGQVVPCVDDVFGGDEELGRESPACSSMFGLSAAYALSPKLMVSLVYDRFPTTRNYIGVAGDPSQPATQVHFEEEADTTFSYYTAGITANFLTERDVKIKPFLNVGVGIVTEERAGTTFCIDLNSHDTTTCAQINPDGTQVVPGVGEPEAVDWQRYLDDQDTGTAITFGVGARWFFKPWYSAVAEFRYYHLDTYNVNQDAFQFTIGANFIVGGKE